MPRQKGCLRELGDTPIHGCSDASTFRAASDFSHHDLSLSLWRWFVSKIVEMNTEPIVTIKGAKTPKQCGATHFDGVDMNSSRITVTE